MAKRELIDLIKKSIAQGAGREQLVSDLIFAGFSYQEIEGALNEMAASGEVSQAFMGHSIRGARMSPQIPVKRISEATEEVIIRPPHAYGKLIVTALSVLALVLVAGGVGVYFYSTSSSVIFSRMLSNLAAVRSLAYSVEISGNADLALAERDPFIKEALPYQSVSFVAKGVADISGGTRASMEISAVPGESAETGDHAWDAGVIMDPSSLYIKLDNLVATTSPNQALVGEIQGKWVFIDTTDASARSALAPARFYDAVAFYQAVPLAAADSIGQIMETADAVSFRSLGSEVIDGVSLYHYEVNINPSAASQMLSSLGALGTSGGGWLSLLVQNPWEVWVSKETALPYRILVKNDKTAPGLLFTPKQVILTLYGFNQQYGIAMPQAQSLSRIAQLVEESAPAR